MTSYSDQGQDLLVSNLIKEKGFFVDIGAAGPISGNNTYLLETLGWDGISVDLSPMEGWQNRKTKCIQANALEINWLEFLEQNNVPRLIDYISMDIDHGNLELMKNFPFDKYEFKILTLEHNQWEHIDKGSPWPPTQQVSEQVLGKFSQYRRYAKDVIYQTREFEDWWINTQYFNDKVNNIYYNLTDWSKIIERLERD